MPRISSQSLKLIRVQAPETFPLLVEEDVVTIEEPVFRWGRNIFPVAIHTIRGWAMRL
jgi:hypothetical protein